MLTSIKSRMAVYVVSAVSCVLLILGLYNYQTRATVLEEALNQEAHLVASRLTLSLPVFIWNFDNAGMEKTVEAEMESPVISTIKVEASQGDTLVKTRKAGEAGADAPVVLEKKVDLKFDDNGEMKKVGTLTLQLNNSHIRQVLDETVWQTAVQMVVLAIILVSLIVFLVSHSVVNKISEITKAMTELAAGGGDLSKRLDTSRGDEISALAFQVNLLLKGLADMIGKVKVTSGDLSQIASSTQRDIQHVLERFDDQKGEVDLVATASTELASATQNVAQNADRAAEYASRANRQADAGQETVREAAEVIRTLSGEINNVSNVIKTLEAEGVNIGSVSDVIQGIAEQTNLLALNAAIEAARAGEQGRGFAVVADEVRTLAQRTHDSTNEINQMIARLQASTAQAVDVMKKSTTYTESSVEQIEKVGESIGEVVTMVTEIAKMNHEIAQASGEQSHVIDELNKNLVHIKESADAASELVTNTAHASEQVQHQSEEISVMMQKFRL